MDRRDFLKLIALFPTLSFSFHEIHQTPFQIYILSSFPEEFLPSILKETFKLGLIQKRNFFFSGHHPTKNKILIELYKAGWKESFNKNSLQISFKELKGPTFSSFTLILKNRIMDLRKGNLFSLWKKMKEKEPQTFWLTTVSQENPLLLQKGEFVKISISGREIERFPLSSELRKSFYCDHGKITISIKNAKVWIEESSCKNKICVKTSPVCFVGERIICAPNKFLLEIKGNFGVDTSIG